MIVHAGAGDGRPVAVLAGGAEAEVLRGGRPSLAIPEGTEAVLVLADVHFPHAAVQLLQELRLQELAASIPVVALLLHAPGRPKDLHPLVGATSVLAAAPVDDIIVQPTARDDLPAVLAVIVERVERREKARQLEAMAVQVSESSRRAPAAGAAPDGRSPERKALSPNSASSAELEPSPEQRAKERDEERRLSVEAGLSPRVAESGGGGEVFFLPPVLPEGGGSSSPSRSEAKRVQSRHSSSQARMWDECRLLRRLRHPNVISVQDLVDAQLSKPLKGSSGPNLKRAILEAGRLSVTDSQVIFYQVSAGLAYIHANKIAHRNVKPESILVSNLQQVKLANFTLAAKLGVPCRDKCGTMPFVAPEVLSGSSYEASAADVWSMGVVLLEMLCGVGKLPRMLGWAGPCPPSGDCARELEDFFWKPDSLLLSVEEDLGGLADGLGFLLSGLLTLAPEERWPAQLARECEWTSAARDSASQKARQRSDSSTRMGECEDEREDGSECECVDSHHSLETEN